MEALTARYTASKPINDKMVDIAQEIQALTVEIYRRSILKQLPGVRLIRTKTVMRISATISPNTGLPQIAQRLVQLNDQGIVISHVAYDENTGDFHFYSAPEFALEDQLPDKGDPDRG